LFKEKVHNKILFVILESLKQPSTLSEFERAALKGIPTDLKNRDFASKGLSIFYSENISPQTTPFEFIKKQGVKNLTLIYSL
jgi:hypothetical protein